MQIAFIERLKTKDQFQGARFELFAAASCIRADFSLEFENERDGSSNHFEFIATHNQTKQKISLEAKSRHRQFVLGYGGLGAPDLNPRVRIGKLLNQASAKMRNLPHVIFIDLNLPPSKGDLFEQPWFKELKQTMERIGEPTHEKPDLFNMIMFINHPEHYLMDTPYSRHSLGVFSKYPKYLLEPPVILHLIHDAVQKFGNIPQNFDE